MKKAVLTFLLVFLTSCSYPTTSEVDQFISGLGHYKGNTTKTKLISAFLNSLRRPDSTEEDEIARYGLRRLGEYYQETKDNSVLQALSTVKMDAGFANMVCGEMKTITKIEDAAGFFKSDCSGIARCSGLSFSESEIRDICE
jgi:hypothetical protein